MTPQPTAARGERSRDRDDRGLSARDEHDRQGRDRERPRGNNQYACKNFFSWPFRRHDDDKDDGGDYDHPSHGGLSGASFWGFDEEGLIRRDRSCSPLRRSHTYRDHGGGGPADGMTTEARQALFAEGLRIMPHTNDVRINDDAVFITKFCKTIDSVQHGFAGDAPWSALEL
jgi:hypothetical protein